MNDTISFRRPVQNPNTTLIDFIQNLPKTGLDAEGFLTMQPGIAHWNENVDITNVRMSQIVAIGARFFATITLGKAFCLLGSTYHAVAGIAKCCVVVIQYNNEEHEKVRSLFKAAMNHLLLSAYNAVAALPLVNILLAIAYSQVPQWVEELHLSFAGTQITPSLEKRQAIHKIREELEELKCQKLEKAIGACVDAAGPYASNGMPAFSREGSSFIAQKAEEISSQILEKMTI